MGLFGIGNRNKQTGANPAANAWANMGAANRGNAAEQTQSMEEQERLNAERQQRKIVAALYEGGGKVHTCMIEMQDVVPPEGAQNKVREMMQSGEIGEKEEREFIGAIMDPITQDGEAGVMRRMNDMHELRILGQMTGGVDGFKRYQEMGAKELRDFVARYPLPADFDGVGEDFVTRIGEQNGPQKEAEYRKALKTFRSKVYGKRQEYWDQMKAIRGEDEASQTRTMAHRGQAVMGSMNGGARGASERERSAEWIPGRAEMIQVSKAQVRQGLVDLNNVRGGLFATEACEDAALVEQSQQLFGVYDGAGGAGGARNASQTAARVTRELSQKYNLQSGMDLAWVLNEANTAVERDPNAGFTTAVLTKVIERGGQKQLAWASVGDSRIYVVDKSGRARLITRDEGEGNRIYNAIGTRTQPGESCVKQFGEVGLQDGDKVVLCSDGITGDYEPDLMSEMEVGDLVSRGRDAREAAVNLVAGARKVDDRTALVFGV